MGEACSKDVTWPTLTDRLRDSDVMSRRTEAHKAGRGSWRGRRELGARGVSGRGHERARTRDYTPQQAGGQVCMGTTALHDLQASVHLTGLVNSETEVYRQQKQSSLMTQLSTEKGGLFRD